MKQINPRALKALRTQKGWTKAKLAEESGLKARRLIELENEAADLHSIREGSFEGLRRALGATEEQLRGEEPPTDPLTLKRVPLHGKITTLAQMNYDLISEEYGVSTDQLLQIAPLMFAILVEDSFAWRKEQLELRKQVQELNKRTRESQYDPDPDLYDVDFEEEIEAEMAAIAAREVFSVAKSAVREVSTAIKTAAGLVENEFSSSYASNRFTDFLAAKVKSSGGRIRADLRFGYLDGRDIRDPDTKYIAVPDLLDAKTLADDPAVVAFTRLLLMSGRMRLHDFRSGRMPEQLQEWLRSEVLPNLAADMLTFAPEVYRFDAETEELSLDEMGFPIRVRRHPLIAAGLAAQSQDEGGENVSA